MKIIKFDNSSEGSNERPRACFPTNPYNARLLLFTQKKLREAYDNGVGIENELAYLKSFPEFRMLYVAAYVYDRKFIYDKSLIPEDKIYYYEEAAKSDEYKEYANRINEFDDTIDIHFINGRKWVRNGKSNDFINPETGDIKTIWQLRADKNKTPFYNPMLGYMRYLSFLGPK